MRRVADHWLQTGTFAGRFDTQHPEYWSLRYEHDDSTGKRRRWRTDIGITRFDERLHLSIIVSHFLVEYWYGQELTPPEHSVPRIVSQIVCSTGKWQAFSARNRLLCKAFSVGAENMPLLSDALLDRERRVPLLLVSNSEDSGKPLLDPGDLSKSLAGIAIVLHLKDPDAQRAFDKAIPNRFHVYNGAVRAYQPQVDINKYTDSYRHRYFTEVDIEEGGIAAIGSAIVRTTVRRDRGDTAGTVASLEDVKFRAFTANLVSDSANAALIKPLFAELDNQKKRYDGLFDDYQELFEQWNGSVSARDQLEEDLRAHERTIGSLRFQLRNSRAKDDEIDKTERSFVERVLAATGGAKIVCVRSKQDGSYIKAVQTMFSLSEDEALQLFEEVETGHGSNQVSSLINSYPGRVVVYAWGHLKSMDADEAKGFAQFFEGQSTRRALQWLTQWLDEVTRD